MNPISISLLALMIGAEPAQSPASADDKVRKSIERSLVFLEKGSVAWLAEKKCATCHHLPMMVWTHNEAARRGFAVHDAAVKELRTAAIGQYLAHESLQPTGQDKGFIEAGPGPGAVMLALALRADPAPDEAATQALEKITALAVANVREDGQRLAVKSQSPLIDGPDSPTMLTMLALGMPDAALPGNVVWERGIAWLKTIAPREETQSAALRVMVFARGGGMDDLRQSLDRLRKLQRPDGGWSQTAELSSDATASGMAILALAAAGAAPDDAAVRQGQAFLLKSQLEDGSWLVPTRGVTGHDYVTSYYGSAWATLGLLHTLPQ